MGAMTIQPIIYFAPAAPPQPAPPPQDAGPKDMTVLSRHADGRPKQIVIPARSETATASPEYKPVSGSQRAKLAIGGAITGGMGGGYVALSMLGGSPAIALGVMAGCAVLGAVAGWYASKP